MKKVAFYTLGCKVNQYETEAMLEMFKKDGYIQASSVYERKLLKQADAFLKQKKVFERERDRYELLLDQYELEIEKLTAKEDKTNGEEEYLQKLLLKERELKKISDAMATDECEDTDEEESFMMAVDEVFKVEQGIVVTGTIAEGEVYVEDEFVLIKWLGERKRVRVAGIEMNRKLLDMAMEGDSVGLLLKGVEERDVSCGDLLVNDIQIEKNKRKIELFERIDFFAFHMIISGGIYDCPGHGVIVEGVLTKGEALVGNDVIVKKHSGEEIETTIVSIRSMDNKMKSKKCAVIPGERIALFLKNISVQNVDCGGEVVIVGRR